LRNGKVEESKYKGMITVSAVNVQQNNTLKVELRGKKGAQIRIVFTPVSAPIP
jgi:hypothetical protein